MEHFQTKTGKDGQYYFSLVDTNGHALLASEGYTTAAARQNGIESVKKNATDDKRYDRESSSNGKFYFTLKAHNGQVVGKSKMFETESDREEGIAAVKSGAPHAQVTEG